MNQFDDDFRCCEVCNVELGLESCWQCMGSGGEHECEDTCPCLDPDEITDVCETCDGEGEYLACPAAPHTEAQMQAYRLRQGQRPEGRSF